MPTHVINTQTSDVQLPVFETEVELTNEEIKALPSAAVMLVPAQGVGKKIVVLDAEVYIDSTAGVYTVDVNARWQLFIGTTEITGLAQPNGSLTIAGVYSLKFPPLAGVGSSGDLGYLVTSAKDFSPMVNQPLNIKDDYNGVADYTGGNTANKVKVKVVYTIISI